MKIRELLELQKTVEPHALERNWGDSYLLQNNTIFKGIRKLVLKSGAQFKVGPDADFQSFPFSQLEKILKEKTIPYYDNVTILEKMSHQIGTSLSWSEVEDGFRRNFLFHESCHMVAREFFTRALKTGPKSREDLSLERARVLQMLLEESFANTCELMANADVESKAHQIFLQTNSYSPLPELEKPLRKAIGIVGFEVLFLFFWLQYLCSNFLRPAPEKGTYDKILKMIGANPEHAKTVKSFSHVPFTLDLNFRIQTTGLHLKLNGFKKSQKELLSFDFLSAVEQFWGAMVELTRELK